MRAVVPGSDAALLYRHQTQQILTTLPLLSIINPFILTNTTFYLLKFIFGSHSYNCRQIILKKKKNTATINIFIFHSKSRNKLFGPLTSCSCASGYSPTAQS